MLESSEEIKPLHGGKLSNNVSNHKLVRYDTLKEFEFLYNALYLMSLLNYRMTVL